MPDSHLVVDGSNIATEGRTVPSLAQLDEAVRTFTSEYDYDNVIVIVDATFAHRIDPSEREMYEEAIVAGEMLTPPAGAIGRGDAFVLEIADRSGGAVLSNDSFQEFHADHEWLFDEGRLWGGKPVPGIGWVFVTRLPVRGPASHRSKASAARKHKSSTGTETKSSRAKGGSSKAGSATGSAAAKVSRSKTSAAKPSASKDVAPKSNAPKAAVAKTTTPRKAVTGASRPKVGDTIRVDVADRGLKITAQWIESEEGRHPQHPGCLPGVRNRSRRRQPGRRRGCRVLISWRLRAF
ncbi:MAG: hypothetical protein V9F03_13180 [Microthrixaceae bacterium]